MGVATLALPGCTDTWDNHYAEIDDLGASKTLWQLVEDNPDLSYFKNIAEKAAYYVDEKHPVKNGNTVYTFKDVLNSNQVSTLWAPLNSSFTAEEYQELLELSEKNGYELQLTFMSNHISLFRTTLASKIVKDTANTIRAINNKRLKLDRINGTLQGVEIKDKNLSAINGVMHTMSGKVPFKYNMYEFLKYSNKVDSAAAFIMKHDTTYFSESSSVPGLTDKDGNQTYVDSVYFTSNTMITEASHWPNDEMEKKTWLMPEKGFRLNLAQEDSSFLMIIPTDEALQKAKEKLAPFYKYAPQYGDEVTMSEGNYLSGDMVKVANPDSIANNAMLMDILTAGTFNLHDQLNANFKGKKFITFDELGKVPAKYYLNAYNDTLKSLPGWEQNSLFELFQGDTVRVSNGMIYLVKDWNFPATYYKPNIMVETEGTYNLMNISQTLEKSNGTIIYKSFNDARYKVLADTFGIISKNSYMGVKGSQTNDKPKIQIPLYTNDSRVDSAHRKAAEVMSGKYDIYMVRVPYWFSLLNNDENDSLFFQTLTDSLGNDSIVIHHEFIDSITDKNLNKFTVKIYYNDGKDTKLGKAKASSSITIDFKEDKSVVSGTWKGKEGANKFSYVDTVLIAKDFEFPYTYKNVRSNKTGGLKTYPYIEIECGAANPTAKKGPYYNNEFYIDRILLVSKETEEEVPFVVE